MSLRSEHLPTCSGAPASYVDKILKGAKPARPSRRAADEVRVGHQPQEFSDMMLTSLYSGICEG